MKKRKLDVILDTLIFLALLGLLVTVAFIGMSIIDNM